MERQFFHQFTKKKLSVENNFPRFSFSHEHPPYHFLRNTISSGVELRGCAVFATNAVKNAEFRIFHTAESLTA